MRGMWRWYVLGIASAISCTTKYTAIDVGDAGAPVAGGNPGGSSGQLDPDAGELPPRALYVSQALGDDANDGLATTRPKRTIASAIAAARTAQLSLYEVRVCRGTHREPGLTLDYAVALRGGYDCTTWARGRDFGRAGGFGDTQETVLEPGVATDATALTITGNIPRSVIVDGFTIHAPAAGAYTEAAALTLKDASPTVADCVLAAFATTSTSPGGSAGLRILRGGPDVHDNRIAGGSGSAPSLSSVGIWASATSAHIHDNIVDGGSGGTTTGSIAAVGIYVQDGSTMNGANAIENNDVTWGPVRADGVACSIISYTSDSDILHNTLRGGVATPVAGSGTSVCGLSGGGAGTRTIHVRDNRVLGGTVVGTTALGFARGMDLGNFAYAEVVNNVVHGGSLANPSAGDAFGVGGTRNTSQVIVNNTIFSGQGPKFARAIAIYDATASTTGAYVIRNNVLVGAGGASDYGISVNGCTVITALENNAFLGFAVMGNTTCATATPTVFTTLAQLESYVVVTSHGASSSDVLPAGAVARWVDGVAPATAQTTLFAGGYPLVATAPCLVSRGGQTLTSLAPKDVAGVVRTPPFSMGAYEQESCDADGGH